MISVIITLFNNENSLTHKASKEKNLLFIALSILDLYKFFKDTFF